jgi:hypothetical protein
MGGRSTPSHRVADISACGGCRPVDATGTYQDRYRRRLLIGPFFKTLARLWGVIPAQVDFAALSESRVLRPKKIDLRPADRNPLQEAQTPRRQNCPLL